MGNVFNGYGFIINNIENVISKKKAFYKDATAGSRMPSIAF